MSRRARRPAQKMHVKVYHGVPIRVGRAAHEVAEWLERTQTIHHAITVHVVPATSIDAGRISAFGVFIWPRKAEERVHIYVAGLIASALRPHGVRFADSLLYFVDTLLHEFVHYEQWRDGREPTERGVKVRSENHHNALRVALGRVPLLKGRGRTLYADGKVRA